MKKFVLCLCALFLVVAGSEAAYADLSYSSVYDYGNGAGMHQPLSGGGSGGADYVTIIKSGSPAFYDQFNLGGVGNVKAATLSITHNGNFDIVLPTGYGEQWKAVGNNGVMLGTLSNSFYDWNTGMLINSWVTDTIKLGPDALDAINKSNPKYLGISFVDGTLGQNTFKLNSVALSATTSPVPLPPAILLFSSGIIGLAGFRRMTL